MYLIKFTRSSSLASYFFFFLIRYYFALVFFKRKLSVIYLTIYVNICLLTYFLTFVLIFKSDILIWTLIRFSFDLGFHSLLVFRNLLVFSALSIISRRYSFRSLSFLYFSMRVIHIVLYPWLNLLMFTRDNSAFFFFLNPDIKFFLYKEKYIAMKNDLRIIITEFTFYIFTIPNN